MAQVKQHQQQKIITWSEGGQLTSSVPTEIIRSAHFEERYIPCGCHSNSSNSAINPATINFLPFLGLFIAASGLVWVGWSLAQNHQSSELINLRAELAANQVLKQQLKDIVCR